MHLPRISEFQEQFPSLESYWRSVILFGRNSSTYKFALARALEDLAREGRSEVALDEIAVPFSRHMCEHLLEAPKQSTGHPGKFIETCSSFNRGTADEQALIDTAVSDGFSYVLRAFHNVNGAEPPSSSLRCQEMEGVGASPYTTTCFERLRSPPPLGARRKRAGSLSRAHGRWVSPRRSSACPTTAKRRHCFGRRKTPLAERVSYLRVQRSMDIRRASASTAMTRSSSTARIAATLTTSSLTCSPHPCPGQTSMAYGTSS